MTMVLDASALIAMIKGEKGSTKVAAGIAGARVSSVNYAEVVTHFIHAGMPEREVDAMLDPLPLTVVSADKALAQIAGRMHAITAEAGLSLALASATDWRHGRATRTGRRSRMPLTSRS